MKRLTSSLVAIAICILCDGYAFGQSPQGSDSKQGRPASDGTNPATPSQSTQWNNCPTYSNAGGPFYATSCYDSRCAHSGSIWTRPLCSNGCFANCCANKSFPGAGWCPPAHFPVNYDGAWYGSYLPQHAYGTPGGGFIANYPTVYQPTDTTQLGYYYNKVPTWQSRSDMIPGVPYPSNFHARICPPGETGFHGHFRSAHGPVNYGPVSYGPAPESCPSGSSGPSSATPQNSTSTTPQNSASATPQNSSSRGHQVVRKTQPKRQGLFSGFRLASMTEVFD